KFQQLREFPTGRSVNSCVAVSRDGQTLATSLGSAIRLWDVRTGSETLPDGGHTAQLSYGSLLPDQKTVITATADGTIRHWELATGRELRRESVPATSIRGIVLSPDGKMAACFKEETVRENVGEVGIRLWDVVAQQERALLWRPNMWGAFFSPDGKRLLTTSWDVKERAGIIRAWDVATGKELGIVGRHSNTLEEATLSPDGKVLAAAVHDQAKAIQLWDTATGNVLCRVPGDRFFQQCFALSPDSKVLAVADGWRPTSSDVMDRHIHLWDTATGKKLSTFGKCDGS